MSPAFAVQLGYIDKFCWPRPLRPPHGYHVAVFSGAPVFHFLRWAAPLQVFNDINGGLLNLRRLVKHPSPPGAPSASSEK